MKRKNEDPNALTEDEVQFLRSDRAPSSVRAFVARQHDQVGTRIGAYRKVAAAARAERDAILEVALLEVVRLRAAEQQTKDEQITALEKDRSELTRALVVAQNRVAALTAKPAMAVYGDCRRGTAASRGRVRREFAGLCASDRPGSD